MLRCQIGKKTLSKSIFIYEFERKKEQILQKTFKSCFYVTFGFISDFNTQDQVQISNIDTDANSKENKVNAADTQSKLESEARPDEGNNSLN